MLGRHVQFFCEHDDNYNVFLLKIRLHNQIYGWYMQK